MGLAGCLQVALLRSEIAKMWYTVRLSGGKSGCVRCFTRVLLF